jgi:Rod binding domain-containing protein
MSSPEISGLPAVPVVNQALEPAAVRNGSPAVQKAYGEALSFESVFVNQLCQQLVDTTGLSGTQGSTDSSSGDPSVGDFASMLPGALSSSIMSQGGLGLAAELLPGLESSGGESS